MIDIDVLFNSKSKLYVSTNLLCLYFIIIFNSTEQIEFLN